MRRFTLCCFRAAKFPKSIVAAAMKVSTGTTSHS
jgi:hypothetical protein